MSEFIDQHRDRFGVEPICKALQVAPSALPARGGSPAQPGAVARARLSATPCCCRRSSASGRATCGSTAPTRSGGSSAAKALPVARCTVERLMRLQGLRGARARQGGAHDGAGCQGAVPAGSGQPRSSRPSGRTSCGCADFTYVSTWQGFVYVAFVIDVFARRIVGWRVSSSMQTDFVLDALNPSNTSPFATPPGHMHRGCALPLHWAMVLEWRAVLDDVVAGAVLLHWRVRLMGACIAPP